MKMQKHITILGTIFIVLNSLALLAALYALIAFSALSVVDWGLLAGDPLVAHALVGAVTSGAGILIGSILFVSAGIIGGIGLLKEKSWSRVLVLILGCLNLVLIPVGTIIGVYALWVLTRAEARQILSR